MIDADLDRLDDVALRGIAYGRADSEIERMRAQRAARILADRASAASAAAGRPRATIDAPSQQPRPDQAGANTDEDSDDPPRWWRSPWRVGVAALTLGALIGGALGYGVPALIENTAPDSLAVFDRPATPMDDGQLEQFYGQRIGETRLLQTIGDIRLFAVRSTSEFIFGSGNGPQICVFATSDRGAFLPSNCVAETLFRERGLSGTLISFRTGSFADSTSDADRFIDFTWGPRGGINARDVTRELREADALSPDDLAAGEGLAITEQIRTLAVDSTVATQLEGIVPPASHGPSRVSSASSGNLRFQAFASIHPDRAGDSEAQVCLTVMNDDTPLGSSCAPVSGYEREGLEVRAASTIVTLSPSGQTLFQFG
ncbi:hypothetical protein EV141_1418 [Microcella putealis]|uniref:Uncharacterized protein n=1 Tax=Microcella putealis TaxID=337005 RepID=A0A4V2EWZ4_9MICO|nr:hypothetical protein [Microcella putealis]RZS57700.1 hypothetical protein EV141_1418 [Microcella putealis]TQM24767.1 hypothetical protein BJ957_1027 [Microcella putealis]